MLVVNASARRVYPGPLTLPVKLRGCKHALSDEKDMFCVKCGAPVKLLAYARIGGTSDNTTK
jgi:hypothetical protein